MNFFRTPPPQSGRQFPRNSTRKDGRMRRVTISERSLKLLHAQARIEKRGFWVFSGKDRKGLNLSVPKYIKKERRVEGPAVERRTSLQRLQDVIHDLLRVTSCLPKRVDDPRQQGSHQYQGGEPKRHLQKRIQIGQHMRLPRHVEQTPTFLPLRGILYPRLRFA